ncbi:MAG: type I secretion C-terminal target domain-containing protein, partial [Legionella sp.]
FTGGDGGGPGEPIAEAGVIHINPAAIVGVEDMPVDISGQLASMLTLTGGTVNDVYALVIQGSSVPAGYSLTGSGVIYDFVNDRYVIRAESNGAGGLTLGSVVLETPKDFSGTLPFAINWAASNLASGDLNTGTAPVQVPVDIAPIVDLPPTINLQIVDTSGLDASMQPGGNETYPNVALEDGLITLNLGISSLDSDGSEQIVSIKLKVDPAVGQLVDANGAPLPVTSGFVTVTLADLAAIRFQPVADYSGPVTLTTQVVLVDSALNHLNNSMSDSQTFTKDISFNVVPVNDRVLFSGVNTFIGNEDSSGGVALTGMTVSTNDADGSEQIVSLVIHGVPDGFLIGSAQNMGNGDWKVTVNSTSYDLSNIKLIAPEDFSGSVDLSVTVYTKEALAALPQNAGTQALNITINPVSDLVDVVGAGPATQISGIENSTPISIALNLQARDDGSSYTGNSAAVSENAPETLLLTIRGVPDGAELALPEGVDGEVVAKILDTATNLWTWTITVNSSQLSNILFSPNDANGAIVLTIDAQAVDGNALPGPVREINVALDILAVNDAPENILPQTPVTTNEDTAVTLEGIRISDIDAKETNGNMTVTLDVAHGTLSVAQSSDVSITGNNSNSITLVGTLDAINNLLAANITYLGHADFNGIDKLTMVTNDNGNSGGPALTATSTLDINVIAVNDAPINTVPLALDAQEDTVLTITQLQVHDIDAEQDNSAITVTLQVAHGTLSLVDDTQGVTVSGNNSDTLVLLGTVAQLNAVLAAGVNYLAHPDFHGSDSLVMTSSDMGNTGIGGVLTDIDTVPITVLPRADVPELTVINQSIVAALGALFPLHLAAEVANPAANELTVRLDGLSTMPVDSNGNPIGIALGNNAWSVNTDQLSNLYVQNLEQGTHTITVTAISSTDTPQDQAIASPPQVIHLNVLDSTQHALEGGAGSDLIIGSELNDILVGVLGDDILEGKAGDDLLYGGEGNDVLNGGEGNDLLIGGPGNDILTGGAGKDIFKWQVDDHGTAGAPDIDVITDFNPQEDKIDLSQLLQGEHAGNYENFLHFEYNAADNSTVLSISTQGQFSENAPAAELSAKTDQVIMLQGVDLVGAPGSQVDLINNLVALQQIIVDG